MKKTVIVGASDNPTRYAQIALQMLKEYDHPIVPIGIHGGEYRGEEMRAAPPCEVLSTVLTFPRHVWGHAG